MGAGGACQTPSPTSGPAGSRLAEGAGSRVTALSLLALRGLGGGRGRAAPDPRGLHSVDSLSLQSCPQHLCEGRKGRGLSPGTML